MQRKSFFALAFALVILTRIFVPAFSITAVPPPLTTTSPILAPPVIDGTLATAVLYPSDDAPVQQGAPGTTGATELKLGAGYDNGSLYSSTGLVRSYLRFDLSNFSAENTVASATLRLYYTSSRDYEGATRTVTFYRVTSNWDENSLTWSNRPGYAEAVGSTSLLHGDFGWVSLNLTNQVKNWVSGNQPNYGLVAIGPENDLGIYRAFIATNNTYVGTPELHINYLPAPPPVLDAWPGNLSARAAGSTSEAAPILNVGNVTYGTLAWNASKVGTASWLTLNQTGGSAAPTTPGTVSFSVDASGLAPGIYTEQIQVSSSTTNVEGSPLVTTFTLEVLDNFHNVYLPVVIGGGGTSSPSAAKIVAVVVGIADYEHLDPSPSSGNLPDAWGYDLYAPIYDVADFVAWLQTHLNVQPQNIIQRTESSATYEGIRDAFDSAAQQICPTSTAGVDEIQACGADTIFIFYYSGHGAQNSDTNGDESDGFDEFIAAYDTNLNELTGVFSPVISDDELEELLAAIPAGRIVVILDSCFSGSMMSAITSDGESPTVLSRGLISPLTPNTPATADALSELTGENRLVITAGTGDQLTWESYALQNGVFTHFFLQGLTDALNDVNENGRVSAEETYWFSRDLVDDWAVNNTPDNDHQNPDINDSIPGQVDLTFLP